MSEFFRYGNNGKEIDINQFKKELEKSGAKEADVKRFFNFFDADGNGKIENTEQHKELDKLNVFYNELKQAANTDGNDVLDDTEFANLFKNENTEIAKEMSKDTTLVSSIKSFLTSLNKSEEKKEKKDNTPTTSTSATVPTELSAEEIAVDTISGDVTTAKEIYNTQRSTQGGVSDTVDDMKEFFDTEFAASKIERYINDEELSLSLLNQAKDGTLTKKSYYEQKISYLENILAKAKDSEDVTINTFAEMLANAGSSALKALGIDVDESKPKSADEIALDLLKAALNSLKPEQIDTLVASTSDVSQLGNILNDVVSGYLSNFNISVDTATVNEPKIIGYIDELTGKVYDSEYKVPMHKGVGKDTYKLIHRVRPKYSKTETEERTITNVSVTQTKPMETKGSVGEIIHSELNEFMTFEEAFKAERGVEYNEENIRDYQLKDAQSKFVLEAYNKKQEVYNTLHQPTVTAYGENVHGETYPGTRKRAEEQLSFAIIQTLTELYGSVENGLEKLGISGVKLQEVEENGFKTTKLVQDFGKKNKKFTIQERELDGYALVDISNKIQETLDKNFENLLGDKKLDDYINETSEAYKKAYGTKNATTLAEGYKQSQEEIVANLRGGLQNIGMAATIVGGVLLMTPAAPIGGALVSVGSKAAMTGMVVNHALGFTEALTRDEVSEDELKELLKDAVVDAAGFIIGMKAGKLADKRFAKLIDTKLAITLKQEITAGNRAEALKMIFTNPDNLKNFATAAGAKFGTDFMISLAGDLALAGLLDTGEDVQQLIKANLMGLIISTSNDLKAATLPTKTHGDSRSVAENPSNRDAAIPAISTIVGGTTTKGASRSGDVDYSKLPTYTQATRPENTTVMPSEGLIISTENGQVVGRLGTGAEFRVDDVEAKPTTIKTQVEERLNSASSREDFVAIRDEIKKLPPSAEKTELQQLYLQKYNEWSSNPSRPDIRMQYIPETDLETSSAVGGRTTEEQLESGHINYTATIENLRDGSIEGIKLSSKKTSELKYKGNVEIEEETRVISIKKGQAGYEVTITPKAVEPKPVDRVAQADAMDKYVFSREFREINQSARDIAEGKPVSESRKTQVEAIEALIDEQTPITESQTVYRSETNLWVFENVETSFGPELVAKMNEVRAKFDEFDFMSQKEQQEVLELKNQIEAELNGTSIPDQVQQGFMSTSSVKGGGKVDLNAAVKYKITVEAGNKALDVSSYYEDLLSDATEDNMWKLETLAKDKEKLFQHGTKLSISKVYFDTENNCWQVEATIKSPVVETDMPTSHDKNSQRVAIDKTF